MTIHARHIENPLKQFRVRVKRAPCWNVIFRPERWEVWTVLAETVEGAFKIAQYHFYRSTEFQIV